MIDVCEIIGRNPRTVERLIGRATKIKLVKEIKFSPWRKLYYCQDQIEITYIDNVADWIIVYRREDKIIENFIDSLGLRILQVNLQYYGIVKYYNIHGLKQIAVCGDNTGNIRLLSIKVFTE
jgi:hypothetical protein